MSLVAPSEYTVVLNNLLSSDYVLSALNDFIKNINDIDDMQIWKSTNAISQNSEMLIGLPNYFSNSESL